MLIFLPVAFTGLSYAKGHHSTEFKNKIEEKIVAFKNKKYFTSKHQRMLAQKDEEIQKLREELFLCQNK